MNGYESESFATFFDAHCTGWVRQFAPKLATYLDVPINGQRVLLDLCCGTGISMQAFSDLGWVVYGVDQSLHMLGIAGYRLAAPIKAGCVKLINATADVFSVPEPASACICLDGSLNHLTSQGELQECFLAVSAALVEHGRFVFDLFEPTHFRHWNQYVTIHDPPTVIVKHGVWDDRTNFGLLRFAGSLMDSPDDVLFEQVLGSRYFTTAEVNEALKGAGLEPGSCDIAYNETGMRPEALNSHGPARLIYEARKM
jgi:SAM-dependent methyltransferase